MPGVAFNSVVAGRPASVVRADFTKTKKKMDLRIYAKYCVKLTVYRTFF